MSIKMCGCRYISHPCCNEFQEVSQWLTSACILSVGHPPCLRTLAPWTHVPSNTTSLGVVLKSLNHKKPRPIQGVYSRYMDLIWCIHIQYFYVHVYVYIHTSTYNIQLSVVFQSTVLCQGIKAFIYSTYQWYMGNIIWGEKSKTTVDGSKIRRTKPVELGSCILSHYLRVLGYISGGWPWDFWTINSIT